VKFIDFSRYLKGPEDFVVEEIIDPKFTRKFKRVGCRVGKMSGDYALCLLRKRGKTTEEAVRFVSKKLGVSVSKIGFAGLKDKNAVTLQHLTLKGVKEVGIDKFVAKNLDLEFLQYTDKCINIGDILGNRFKISLHKAKAKWDALERLSKYGFPNYFGPQRFGKDGKNHIIGKRILKEKKSSFSKERSRFYIHSYQSYLFNTALENYLKKGGKPIYKEMGILGYNQKVGRSQIEKEIIQLAKKDGITWKDFKIDQMKLLSRGTKRPAFVKCDMFLHGPEPLVLKFILPPGSYATALLQELLEKK